MAKVLGSESTCSIARALDALGDSWTLLVIREAMLSGTTRFQDFREALGIAPNILTKRLASLVESGVMERRSYREAGSRVREEYVLTESGRALSLVVAALGTWGRLYKPHADGTSPRFTTEGADAPAELAFVDPTGRPVRPDQVVARQTNDTDFA